MAARRQFRIGAASLEIAKLEDSRFVALQCRLRLIADAAVVSPAALLLVRRAPWQTFGVAVDVVTEIDIKRPRDEVAAFAADPANATAWYKNIKAVEWETSPPVVVGSRVRFRAHFLGRTLNYTYEVREVEPGRRFVMATAQGPFPMQTTYIWDDAPDGATQMTLRNTGEPSGFAAVTAPVMARAMRKANESDLRRLKALLER